MYSNNSLYTLLLFFAHVYLWNISFDLICVHLFYIFFKIQKFVCLFCIFVFLHEFWGWNCKIRHRGYKSKLIPNKCAFFFHYCLFCMYSEIENALLPFCCMNFWIEPVFLSFFAFLPFCMNFEIYMQKKVGGHRQKYMSIISDIGFNFSL